MEEHRDHEGTVTPHGLHFPRNESAFSAGVGSLFQTYWLLVIINTAEGWTVALLLAASNVTFHVLFVQFDVGHQHRLARKRRTCSDSSKQNASNFNYTMLPLLLQHHHHPYTANDHGS